MSENFRALSVGQSGPAVRTLQARLLDFGAAPTHDELVAGMFGASTRYQLIAVQQRLQLPATGVADPDTVRALNAAETTRHGYVVGLVLGPREEPATGVTVRAFDRDMRAEQPLGEPAVSGVDGFYQVTYTLDQAREAEAGTADVVVRAYQGEIQLTDPPMAETEFNAGPLVAITVRLAVAVAPEETEYERIVRVLRPLVGKVALTDLAQDERHQDLTFLSGETRIAAAKIEHVAVAHRLLAATKITAPFFYALFALDTLASATHWASLTPRLRITLASEVHPLLLDIALLSDEDITAAVRRAVETFLVPRAVLDQLPEILEMLGAYRAEARRYAAEQRERVLNDHLQHLLDSDLVAQVTSIMDGDAFGDLPGLFDRLFALDPVAPQQQADRTRGKLSLVELLGNDAGLIEHVRAEHGLDGFDDAHRLATIAPADWAKAVQERADRPVDDEDAARQGDLLAERMANRYPTTAFAHRLSTDDEAPLPHAAAVADLLATNPEFDLATGDVRSLLAEHPEFTGSGPAAALRSAQRVFRLAPNYAKSRALLADGLHSAGAVLARGRDRFVRDAVRSGAFDAGAATAAFAKAADVHTASLVLAGQLTGAASATMLPALAEAPAKLEPVVKDFPSMKSLFSTIDLCECSDCRSVHGAPAYLVDVLQYLSHRLVTDTTTTPAVTVKGALTALLQRRPDLAVTDLNCANTNTELPYLDVVCELLEDAVAPHAGIAFAGAVAAGPVSASLLSTLQGADLAFTTAAIVYGPDLDGGYVVRDTAAVAGLTPDGGGWRIRTLRQTFGTSAQVSAAPEYVNDDAYARLASSPFCFALPFDLSHQETRRYFAQFDVDRAELMRLLQTGGTPSDAACAAESLGLSDAQRLAVVTPDVANQPTIWNTPAAPAASTLSTVATFLIRAGITYADLLDLVDRPWLDGGQDLFVRHLDSTSDLAQKQIVNLDDTALDRFHRFLRVRTATGWPTATLDRAIRSSACGKGVLDDACLIAITALIRASRAMGLSIDATLDLLEPLSLTDGTYPATFLDPVRTGSVDSRFQPAAVLANEAAETSTPGSGGKLSAAAGYLGLALGTTPADTATVLALTGTDPALTTASVSRAYALARLCVTLHLSAADLDSAIAVTGLDPLASADDLTAFATAVTRLRATPLPPATWRYLLRHEAADLTTYEVAADTVTSLLTTLHDVYAKAALADASPYDADATPAENTRAVRPFLNRLPGITAGSVATAQTLLDDAWTDPAVTEAAFVDATFGPFFDTTALKAALTARAAAVAPKDAAQNAVIEALATAVSDYLYRTDRETALGTAVATDLAAEADVVDALLNHAHLEEPVSAGGPLLHDVLLDDDTSAAATDLKERSIRLLHTISLATGKLELTATTIAWLLDNAKALGWLRWDHLPYEAGQPVTTYAEWLRLNDFLDLLATYPDTVDPAHPTVPVTAQGFYDAVLAGGPALGTLALLTGTDPDTLTALDTHLGFAVADYTDPATGNRLLAAATVLRTFGLDVPGAVAVTAPVLGPAEAKRMRAALKTRYADTEWLGVLKQIQDGLRPLKRDALVAYLLAVNPHLAGVDDLYDYFLIDVQMSAGMATSRIVQAHATVQLFAMRCLMALEPTCVAQVGVDDGWAQWSWMANFRVWEANRKIFLWPENWHVPSLRDDRSELFVKLDDQLQQDALTDLSVEDATGAYLERLDDIAHLDVMAVYYDTAARIEHVFARTKGGAPYTYFHRQFIAERAWTPWTTVPLDITGDQLLAFSRNSRLTLAWPVFTSEPDDKKNPPDTPDPASLGGGKANDKPDKRWKIQLAVSEYAGGRWREKRISHDGLHTLFGPTQYDPSHFNFFVWALGATQAITCFSPGGYLGSFALTGCKGYPEPQQGGSLAMQLYPRFKDTDLLADRFTPSSGYVGEELTIKQLPITPPQPIFGQTPSGPFEITYPFQLTVIDWLVVAIELWAQAHATQNLAYGEMRRQLALPLGTLLPYFYGDYNRGYVLVPGFYPVTNRRDHPRPVTEADLAKYKKTASDVLQLIDDVTALVVTYVAKFKATPGMTAAELIDELKKDPAYLAVVAQIDAFRGLRYGLNVRNFHHPLVCRFRSELNAAGVPAMMRREVQLADTGFDFAATYQPQPIVVQPYPREDVDFELAGAYSSYNWELFFHLPFDIATRLGEDQQFEKARDWYHLIFNPVGIGDRPAPRRYWNTKPFFQTTPADYLEQRIDTIMGTIAADPAGATIGDLAFEVDQWRRNPFMPDVVARSRPIAFQVATVMNYVQNLVDWGDSLFRQFTRESVNQATQLYVLAGKLLGKRPDIVPPAVPVPDMTYAQLRGELDLFGNALLDLENLVPDLNLLPHKGGELPPPPATLTSLYFCIPPNENLLALWDLVSDRLTKIRNCENIDGIAASLALFSPPIDPGALVRAAAAGLDLSAFLAGLGAPPPHYRFVTMAGKATELTQHVAGLGSELLVALEKKDAEALGRLRDEQEIAVLDSVRAVKLATIEEAKGSLESLRKGKDIAQEKLDFYTAQPFMSTWEYTAAALNGASLLGEAAVGLGYALSGGLRAIPDFLAGGAGFGGSPTVTVTTGGASAGKSGELAVGALSSLVRAAEKGAGMANTQATYHLRADTNDFNAELARREIAQIDQQITTAQLHLDMLAADLATHDLQRKNAQKVADFMKSKYTNKELYTWMIGQLRSVYYQAYKLAFDTAKKAERCYVYELDRDDSFIGFGYWDSMKKGLMTADALLHDIKRMEMGYLDHNAREYELTKHVSMAQLDPGALLQLKNTGKVTFSVPELAFALDYPNQFHQRIVSASATLVCNAGPYTTVGVTMSLVGNKYRKSTAARTGAVTDKDKYAEDPGNDPRFAYNIGSTASIATSTAVSDSGLFELNFHDERYLPFEGAGAVSTWQIEMSTAFPQFDPATISDFVLTLRYRAREGGSSFRAMVEKGVAAVINETALNAGRQGLYLSFDMAASFPDEWWQLKQTGSTTLTIGEQHLPYFARSHTPVLGPATWAAKVAGAPPNYVLTVGGTATTINRDPVMKNLCVGTAGTPVLGTPITVSANAAKLEDLVVLVHYTVT
ncbi:neuraminidase-like domain-containing protein [Labedaea rhizosphaerae]|uniref:Putative peptidoglycan binding protein n=1 Tax=Labedaea rhizosphaerae TaxID=598644 RepID=A0A4V3CY74_LABRH|nr:neuraminidase-like domain-containing protein [Labedaea rhizosphaerae]TDP92928.1 putative peptidoglycan binding protein [Labedaea rhizosphaerae]